MKLMTRKQHRTYGCLFYLQMACLTGLLICGPWMARTGLAEEIVDRIVAVVNNEVITYLELQQVLAPYEEKIKSMGYTDDEEREMRYKVREDMIHRLIDEKLADQEINKNKITISEAEIDASIEGLKASRMWSDEDLRSVLETEGMTMQELRENMRRQALRSRLIGKEVSSKIVITQEEVLAYYNSHAEAYQGQLYYHLRNIVIPVPPEGEGGKAAAQTKLDVVKQKLLAGESFETVAREHSVPSLAKNGGDLGKILYDDISPQIKMALEGLGPGDHTDILETDQGFQIFFIEEIVREGGRPFEEVSPEIEEKLYNDAMDKTYTEWLDELKRQSHIKIIR